MRRSVRASSSLHSARSDGVVCSASISKTQKDHKTASKAAIQIAFLTIMNQDPFSAVLVHKFVVNNMRSRRGVSCSLDLFDRAPY